MMRFVRLRLEDRQQLRYEAIWRIELNSGLYCRVLNDCMGDGREGERQRIGGYLFKVGG